MLAEFFILVALLLYIFYRWAVLHKDFFKERGIPYDKQFPLFGSMKDVVFHKKSMFDAVKDLYNMHDGKVFGVFDQRIPLYMIRDPEIVKHITVKDFDHFVNHRSIFADNDDGNLFGSSLFLMKDGRWKDMRSTLSPAFTGSKMRHMFQLMNQVAQDTIQYLKSQADTDGNLEIDAKDYFTRFTNDIIASTAFGIQVNSFKEKTNEFYITGKKVTTFKALQNIKFFLYANFKPLMKYLKVDLFDRKSSEYFKRLVLDAMNYRQKHNISRPDMINMLMEARGMIKTEHAKSHDREWTDIEIVAQCFLFFFAGFETSSVLMCFAAHELMENPDVQERLLEEIKEVTDDLDGKPLTYEALQGMKYLDMVTSEVLRKWPAAIALDRVCNKDITYDLGDGTSLKIQKGEALWLPVCGFHRDPKYFENPEKFDPERFSDENKDKINPFAYIPFGVGPRNCIGSRFALLEAKAILFYLVRDFHIVAAKNTTIPMKLSASNFQLLPKSGFWLKFIPRTKGVA